MGNQLVKSELRKLAMSRRNGISNKDQKSSVIAKQIIDVIVRNNYKSVGIYMSFEDEVHTSEIISYCFANHIAVAIPKVEQGVINFYRIYSFDDVEEGHFKVMEPIPKDLANEVELQLVPMLAFDASCNRIGYGKGYYDRYLMNFNGDVIGIAYDEQKVDTVPVEEHDQKLPIIVSEEKIYHR